MALSHDVKVIRYGTHDGHQNLAQPLGASVTVYRGSIALTGSNGFLKNASSPASTDRCWGLIEEAISLASAFTAPGIINPNTTNGGVTVDIQTGSFLLAAGTGADALSQADCGNAVYVVDEITVGKTNGSNTRPTAGVLLAVPDNDASIPSGFVAVKLGSTAVSGP